MNKTTENFSERDCSNIEKFGSGFTKSRLIKNLIVLSFSFLVSFCASDGLNTLQSTLNKDVGVICLALQYVTALLAALFLPKYLIRNFGSKIIIFASMLLYVPYVASNFYPHFSLMVPCSILVGFGVSLIWSSVCTYLNDLSALYSNLCFDTEDDISKIRFNTNNKLKQEIPGDSNFGGFMPKDKDGILVAKSTVLVKDATSELLSTLTEINFSIEEQKADLKNNENAVEAISNRQKFDLNYELGSTTGNFSNQSDCISQNYGTNSSFNADYLANEGNNSVNNPNPFYSQDQNFDAEQKNVVISHKTKENSGLPQQKTKILETTTARFFGAFGCIYQICHIMSNVISYFVLQNKTADVSYYKNQSCVCGSQFCDINSDCFAHNLQLPSTETRYTLISIYVVMSVLSAVCAFFFLDDVRLVKERIPFSFETAFAIIKFQKNQNQILLIPMSLFIGLAQAFFYGDYNKDYVGCAWGVNHVPLVGIAYGSAISLSSCLFGWLEKHMGRRIIFLIAVAVNIAVSFTMLTWVPDSNEPTMMFVVIGMAGAALGTMWCHLRAFIGIIFQEEEEAGFASYQVWHAIGCGACFAYSNYICDYIKIYILLTVSTIGAIGYLMAERNYSMNKKCLT